MPDLVSSIVVSAGFGALIGLIRQWGEQNNEQIGDFAGLRTHTFWAVLGCLGAYLTTTHTPYGLIAIMVLVAAHLVAQAVNPTDNVNPGSTAFAGALLTLFCGALVYWEDTKAAILVAATTMVILGIKKPLHTWTRSLNTQDIHGTLQFAAISGVILPLVPNRAMGPYEAFNPFSTWLMVVLISGLGFAGYVAMRIVGARAGILLTGVLGGLASSTASTLAFSRRSREDAKLSEHYALAVVAACTVMLPRVVLATAVINRDFALTLIVPFILMALPGLLFAGWVWWLRASKREEGDTPNVSNPLKLSTAIKFAALYSLITFGVKVVQAEGWTQGLLTLSFVSGLTDMDAISLSMASETDGGFLVTQAVVLAAVSNTLLKAGMAVALGSRGLKLRISVVLGATAALGVAWMLFGEMLPNFGGFATETTATEAQSPAERARRG